MTREDLKNWTMSTYNEDTDSVLEYYMQEDNCVVGAKAYLYSEAEDAVTEMEIIHVIRKTDDVEYYDCLDDEALLRGESRYGADTSAEFITDSDCYLVWFKYANKFVVDFGDECHLTAKSNIIPFHMNTFDEIEYDCWDLIKKYAQLFGIELQHIDGEGEIDFSLAKEVQETILNMFEDAGFIFKSDDNDGGVLHVENNEVF